MTRSLQTSSSPPVLHCHWRERELEWLFRGQIQVPSASALCCLSQPPDAQANHMHIKHRCRGLSGTWLLSLQVLCRIPANWYMRIEQGDHEIFRLKARDRKLLQHYEHISVNSLHEEKYLRSRRRLKNQGYPRNNAEVQVMQNTLDNQVKERFV